MKNMENGVSFMVIIIIIIGGCFSDVSVLLSTMLHWVYYQTPGIHMIMYCFYSGFIDSTFLRICAVPRIADLWRL